MRARLGLALGRRAALADVVALLAAELRIGARIAVDEPVGEEVDEAEDRGQAEAPSPAEGHDRDRDKRHANDVGEFRGGVEDRGRSRTLAARKPVAGGLGIGRKGWRLRDAEQDTRREDRAEAGCERDHARGDAPQEGANAADRRHAKPVEHDSNGYLQNRVGPEEGAEQQIPDQPALGRIPAAAAALRLRCSHGRSN